MIAWLDGGFPKRRHAHCQIGRQAKAAKPDCIKLADPQLHLA
jgi:hypothetical protein